MAFAIYDTAPLHKFVHFFNKFVQQRMGDYY